MAKTPQRLVDYRKKKCRKEIYFSHEEVKAFEKVADAEGEKVGVVIRNMALAYLQQQRLPSKKEIQKLDDIKAELAKVSLTIRNIANNVNQISHRSNTLKVMVDEQDLLLYLKHLDYTLKETIENQLNDH